MKGRKGKSGCFHSLLAAGEDQLEEGSGFMAMEALRCPVELNLALRSSHPCTWVTNHDICFRADLREQAVVKHLLFKSRVREGTSGPSLRSRARGVCILNHPIPVYTYCTLLSPMHFL